MVERRQELQGQDHQVEHCRLYALNTGAKVARIVGNCDVLTGVGRSFRRLRCDRVDEPAWASWSASPTSTLLPLTPKDSPSWPDARALIS